MPEQSSPVHNFPLQNNHLAKPCSEVLPISPLSIEERAINAASAACFVRAEMILGRSQSRQHVIPRQIAAALMREAGLSFPSIGRALNRDHTTVMYGYKRLAGLASRNLYKSREMLTRALILMERSDDGA